MRILVVPADRTEPHGAPRNLGDAFLSDRLATAIHVRGLSAEVVDFGAVRTAPGGQRLRAAGTRGLAAAIRRADAVLVGGGTLFQDNDPARAIGGLPRLCAVTAALARGCRRPIAYYGVGMDPIRRTVARNLVGWSAARGAVWLRDAQSCARYEASFGREAHLGADAALLGVRDATARPRSGLTLALNRVEARRLTPELARGLVARHGRVRFLSMDQESGRSDGASLPARTAEILGWVDRPVGWQDALDVVRRSEVVVASRMHALYMAALSGVPAVAVSSREKVVAFTDEFGVPRADEIACLDPGIARVPDPVALRRASLRAETSLSEALDYLEASRHR